MSSIDALGPDVSAKSRIKPKMGSDDWIMRGYMIVLAVYLIVALALPLYAMLSKAFETSRFDLTQFEVQVSDEAGTFNQPAVTLKQLNDQGNFIAEGDLATSTDGRLALTKFFPDFSFRSPVKYRMRGLRDDAVFLVGSERFEGTNRQSSIQTPSATSCSGRYRATAWPTSPPTSRRRRCSTRSRTRCSSRCSRPSSRYRWPSVSPMR